MALTLANDIIHVFYHNVQLKNALLKICKKKSEFDIFQLHSLTNNEINLQLLNVKKLSATFGSKKMSGPSQNERVDLKVLYELSTANLLTETSVHVF